MKDEYGLEPQCEQRVGFVDLIDGTSFSPTETIHFNIVAAAHGLAMQPRFGGQTTEQYSVAQHSVLVAMILERLRAGDPFEGLIHDISEFILGDMPTPFKAKYKLYAAEELALCGRMRVYYGLPARKSSQCHIADKTAAFMEAYLYTPNKGTRMSDVYGLRNAAIEMIPRFSSWLEPIDWRTAKERFLTAFRKYEGVSYHV